jgi:hypothetical protein
MEDKMTFTQTYGDFKITMEFSGDKTWAEALTNFEQFLRGCGYHFDGHFELVEEDGIS